jgi:hypothetical protein
MGSEYFNYLYKKPASATGKLESVLLVHIYAISEKTVEKEKWWRCLYQLQQPSKSVQGHERTYWQIAMDVRFNPRSRHDAGALRPSILICPNLLDTVRC